MFWIHICILARQMHGMRFSPTYYYYCSSFSLSYLFIKILLNTLLWLWLCLWSATGMWLVPSTVHPCDWWTLLMELLEINGSQWVVRWEAPMGNQKCDSCLSATPLMGASTWQPQQSCTISHCCLAVPSQNHNYSDTLFGDHTLTGTSECTYWLNSDMRSLIHHSVLLKKKGGGDIRASDLPLQSFTARHALLKLF